MNPSTGTQSPNGISNGHLSLKNYRPNHKHSNSSTTSNESSSFFLVVTGSIESASSLSSNEHLYCRYSFNYGPDWEVVHGMSMGLSQIARQGIVKSKDDSSIVFNFPIEVSFQSTNPHGWPRLALSIYGFDFLGRDVLRGYASLLLPINPGKHVRKLKTFRPVSGGRFQQLLNWVMGTNPEYYDSKMVTKAEGRSATRVVSEDGMSVKVNLSVMRKDFNSFGYCSQME